MTPRYQILSRIAEGGFATVDHARDLELGIDVALKRPRPHRSGSAQQLQTEAQVLAQVRHEHIVRFYCRSEDEAGSYLVLEWIAGATLDHYIEQRALTPASLHAFLEPLLLAVAALHDNGFAHGDLNATNVMVDENGSLKVIDFGNAFRLRDALPSSPSTPNIGAIHHMAPELFSGQPPSVRTDLYAIGVLAYHALTQRFPFTGDSKAQAITAHRHQACEPLAASPLSDWVHRLLARDPDHRPASAVEALHALPATIRA